VLAGIVYAGQVIGAPAGRAPNAPWYTGDLLGTSVFSGRIGNVRPFARVGFAFEGRDDPRFVSASSVTLGGHYSIPTLEADGNYVEYLLGASTDFGRVTGYVAGSATSGRSEGNDYGVTVGLRVPL